MYKKCILTTASMILICCAVSAQGTVKEDASKGFIACGYSTDSPDFIVEPANYGVHYLRTQEVLEEATGEKVPFVDTLFLAIGPARSVFYDPEAAAKNKKWISANIRRIKKLTKPSSMEAVPLSSVCDKLAEGEDFYEADFSEPVYIYADRKGSTVTSCLYGIDCIMSEQRMPEMSEWQISDRVETVLGYECSMASVNYAGRIWNAWFTMDIPVGAGPWKFFGLPGLILKVEDSEGLFRYEATEVGSLDNAAITMYDELEKSKPEYFNRLATQRRSERDGAFLLNGEQILTVSRPYTFTDMELSGR